MCHREASFPEMWSLPTAKPFDPSDYLKIFFDTGVLKGRAKGSGVVLFPFLVLCIPWALSVQELLFLVSDNILRLYDNFFFFQILSFKTSCQLRVALLEWILPIFLFFIPIFHLSAHLFYFLRGITRVLKC